MATVRLNKREKELVDLWHQIIDEGYEPSEAAVYAINVDPKADPVLFGFMLRAVVP